ncbi:gluconokinase [Novosphingobium endophyticum]|uniref:Gluconokinase n=1 Tax=Novosphingobium endophyticum TaxID=1955250 RepID=A0A916TUW0_9SPHN|nr:gluconokinase [Novosphingobium endophyticum]GGC11744.1 gluconokinase [Novosphingobium endophyticum]
MGPSGCGKSALARALAAQCDWRFIEGDDHHLPRNIAKMAQGTPLNDEDRQPFFDSIGPAIQDGALPAAVSCSALRRAHRDQLRRNAPDILFVWIDVPPQELWRRVQDRADHFMPVSLLRDQLATLEPPTPPERFVKIDGMLLPADQLEDVLHHLRSFRRNPQAAPRRSA